MSLDEIRELLDDITNKIKIIELDNVEKQREIDLEQYWLNKENEVKTNSEISHIIKKEEQIVEEPINIYYCITLFLLFILLLGQLTLDPGGKWLIYYRILTVVVMFGKIWLDDNEQWSDNLKPYCLTCYELFIWYNCIFSVLFFFKYYSR